MTWLVTLVILETMYFPNTLADPSLQINPAYTLFYSLYILHVIIPYSKHMIIFKSLVLEIQTMKMSILERGNYIFKLVSSHEDI